MHARVEKAVAVAGWVIAAALALMLFVGPQLVAEDKAEPAQQEAAGASPYAGGTSGARPDGEALFTTELAGGAGHDAGLRRPVVRGRARGGRRVCGGLPLSG